SSVGSMLAISFAICSPADAEIPLESTIIDHTRLLRRALYARTKQNIASSMSPNPDYGVKRRAPGRETPRSASRSPRPAAGRPGHRLHANDKGPAGTIARRKTEPREAGRHHGIEEQ